MTGNRCGVARDGDGRFGPGAWAGFQSMGICRTAPRTAGGPSAGRWIGDPSIQCQGAARPIHGQGFVDLVAGAGCRANMRQRGTANTEGYVIDRIADAETITVAALLCDVADTRSLNVCGRGSSPDRSIERPADIRSQIDKFG